MLETELKKLTAEVTKLTEMLGAIVTLTDAAVTTDKPAAQETTPAETETPALTHDMVKTMAAAKIKGGADREVIKDIIAKHGKAVIADLDDAGMVKVVAELEAL